MMVFLKGFWYFLSMAVGQTLRSLFENDCYPWLVHFNCVLGVCWGCLTDIGSAGCPKKRVDLFHFPPRNQAEVYTLLFQ